MKKNLTKILAFVLTLTMIVSLMVVPASGAIKVDQVGALWNYFTPGSGTFTVTDDSRVFVAATTEPTGDLLQTAQLIQRQLKAEFDGAFTELVWGSKDSAKKGDIVLVLDAASGTGADSYKLDVTETAATVTAADTDGLIYGANNLMKCFRAVDGTSISCFSGYDAPDTKERTVHLDLARKYYTVEWVKNFIRQMSWMGYNALELHLSEDGGFRADFWDETYYTDNYQPENDFTWLAGSYVQSWVKDPYRDDPNVGEYLTTKELVEICEVAKEYHIEIIPSFDSPAHMDYITWKFEQNYKSNTKYSFTYNGTTYKASSTAGCINYTGRTGASSGPTWPYYTTIDITDGTMSKAFVFALYEDMADFFKEYAGSTNFNIGADEVNLSSSYGPKWSYSQFPGYINELNRMLNTKGYTVRMYNDFIGSFKYNNTTPENPNTAKAKYTFDKNIQIVYWNSDYNPTDGYSALSSSYHINSSDYVWHVKFFWENNDGNTDNWGDGGRTMYNAIQTNTYYVLREGTSGDNRDARDPDNRNWTFYGTNEEDIYNKWYPADISEKGVYTENATDVPDAQLGGAYFLIWNDYAALSNEYDVWNGALDCWDKDTYYYLFDIMASNITKMWNSDINSSVTYSKFAEVREATLEWFPGFTSCSAAADLPAAANITKANAADKTALNAALQEGKVENTDGKYTAGSYAAYEEAYEEAYTAALAVKDDPDATQDEVDAALNALLAAENALQEKADKSTLQLNYNGTKSLMEIDYTPDSWAALQTVLAEVKRVLDDADATQKEVDNANTALNDAKKKLVLAKQEGGETPDEPEVSFEVEMLSKTAVKGKKVGLRIVTEANADTPVVKNSAGTVIKTDCWSAEQTIDGETVIVWLVEFDTPNVSGNYTVTVGEDVAALPIKVG